MMSTTPKIRIGPYGLYYFNRETGLNVVFDELAPQKKYWSQAPRQVSIALTNACDLKCSFCYAPKKPASLDFNQLLCWLTELDANGCIGIGFGGGEPTLYPQLDELCCFIKQHTSMAVSLTTHAHHLDKHLLSKLTGNIHFIRISMDGVEKTYENIRKRPFADLLLKIKEISKNFSFGINFVVNSETISDLEKAIEIAEDLGAAEFLLLPEISMDKGLNIDSRVQTSLRHWVKNRKTKIPLATSTPGLEGLTICNPLEGETGLSSFAHIDASGSLKKSSYDISGIKISKVGIIQTIHQIKALEGSVTP